MENKRLIVFLIISLCFRLNLICCEVIIQTNSFTQNDFNNCKQQYLLQCGDIKDYDCEDKIKIFEERLQKSEQQESSQCQKCNNQKELLKEETDFSDSSYKFPKSCTECYTSIYTKNEDDEVPYIIEKYFLETMRECASTGTSGQKTKTYKKTYETCLSNCKRCDQIENEDSSKIKKCDELKLKVSFCLVNDDNSQCQTATRALKDTNEYDFVPFSLVVCKQSCKININQGEELFGLIQDCQEQCLFDEDPIEDNIKVKDFKYKEFENCQIDYVLQCPKVFKNAECEQWVKHFNDKISENCKQCNQEVLTLKKKDQNDCLMPESCSNCYAQSLKIEEGEKVVEMIQEYFLPTYLSCAKTGAFSKSSKISKIQQEKCTDNCFQCQNNDQDCITNVENFQKCQEDSANLQCKHSLQQYQEQEQVPYSYEICRESCSPQTGSETYNQYSSCQSQCLTKKIETTSFTLEGYQQCREENVLVCPEWDTDCINSISLYDSKFQKLEIDVCKQCEDEKKSLKYGQKKEYENSILFPISCLKCHTSILIVSKDTPKKVAEYYVNILKDCSISGQLERQSKYNVNQFKNCQQKCDNCGSDQGCKKDQEKFKACVADLKNQQCKTGNVLFSNQIESEILSYPYIVCQESCRIPTQNKKYEQIQQCQDKCYIGEDYEYEIEQETFTYEAYQICKKENVFNCPNWDKSCTSSVNQFEKSLNGEDGIEECVQCNSEKRILIEKDKTLQFGFPNSCLECHKRVLIAKEDTPKKIQEFYLQVYKNCALFGSKERESYTKKSVYNECKNQCDSCSVNDDTCKIQQTLVKSCTEDQNNEQCKFGQQQFQKTQDDENLPYSFVLCEESCMIEEEINQRFAQIQTCINKCYIGESSDIVIDTKEFTYEGYLQCKKENVLECPQYNQQCIQLVERYEENLKDQKIENCALCEKEKHILRGRQKAGEKEQFLFPLSCTLCHNQVLIPQKDQASELITRFYIPALRDCAQQGKLDQTSKITTLKYKECLTNNCDSCKDESTCKKEEEQRLECLNNINNQQCKFGWSTFYDADDNNLLPYPYIICQQSCNIVLSESNQYKDIQNCRNKCMIKKDQPEVIIETQDFTYAEFLECKQQNVMNCDKKDTKCQDYIQIYYDKLQDNLQEDCELCKVQQRILRERVQNTDNYKFPLSCSNCYKKQLTKLDDTDTSRILAAIYLQNYKDCALFGKIERESLVKTTKSKFLTCQTSCDQCGTNNICSSNQLAHQLCFSDKTNQQCVYGLDAYNQAKDEDPLPYSYVICKESCRQYGDTLNQKYRQIQECFDRCYQGLDPNPIIEVNEKFTYEMFLTCSKHNVFKCPSQDIECEKAVKLIQFRINSPAVAACKNCKTDQEILKKQQEKGQENKFFMPLSCIECYNKVLVQNEDDNFPAEVNEYYIKPLRDCAMISEISYELKIIKQYYEKCLNQCDNCKDDKDCIQSQTDVRNCINNYQNDQCVYGLDQYSKAQKNDKVPVSYINCKQSCRNTVTLGSQYEKIQQCDQICQDQKEPETKSFKYKDFLECKKKYVLNCPTYNQQCSESYNYYQQKIEKSQTQKCKLCNQELSQQQEREETPQQNEFLFPLSCSECYIEQLDDKINYEKRVESPEFQKFYVQNYLRCAQEGKIDPESVGFKTHLDLFQSCRDKCVICNTEECKADQKKFQECQFQKNQGLQCEKGALEYYNLDQDGYIPYSFVVCLESCKIPNPDKIFQKRQTCLLQCSQLKYEVLDYTFFELNSCVTQLVAQPQQESKAQEHKYFLEQCLRQKDSEGYPLQKDSQIENCQICLQQNKQLSNDNLVPVPCKECFEKCKSQVGDVQNNIYNQYIKATYDKCFQDPLKTGVIIETNNNISYTENCINKCGLEKKCDSVKCIDYQKQYDTCKQNADPESQCYKAFQKLQKMKEDELEILNYPYEIEICREGCFPITDILDKQFDDKFQCNSDCSRKTAMDTSQQNYSYEKVDSCLQLNYPTLLNTDSFCYKHQENLNNCMKKSDGFPECKWCLELSPKPDSLQYKNTLFYTACADCARKCINSFSVEKKNTLQTIINIVLIACYGQGEFTESQTQLIFERKVYQNDALKCETENCKCENCPLINKQQDDYQKQNKQCQFSQKFYDKIDINKNYMPFPLIVCKYAVNDDVLDFISETDLQKTEEEQYTGFFKCIIACDKIGLPPVVIERKKFTIQGHSTCIHDYCPKFSSSTNAKAYTLQKEINNYFLQTTGFEKINECLLCSEYTSYDQDDLYPVDCQKCRIKSLEYTYKQNLKDDQFSKLVEPCYQQCDENGIFSEPKKFINATIQSEIDCRFDSFADDCNQTLDDYQYCKKDKQLFESCIDSSSQCLFAQQEYNQYIKDKDKSNLTYPYKMYLCHQGCKLSDSRSESFSQMFEKMEKCQTQYYYHEPEFLSHSSQQVEVCLSRYVANCPPFDKYCQYQLGQYNTCYNKKSGSGEQNNCQRCNNYMNENRKKDSDIGKHPTACYKCAKECMKLLENSKSEVFRTLTHKQILECHRSALPQDIYGSLATKNTYIKCRLEFCKNKINCESAKNIPECRDQFKSYSSCEEGVQCLKSQDIYNNADNSDIIDSSKLICAYSCLPNDVGFDFYQIFKCDLYCQQNEFTPQPKPDKNDTSPNEQKKEQNKFSVLVKFSVFLTIICIFLSIV